MMSVGSSENPSLHVVKSGINLGSIHLVGPGGIAGIDRMDWWVGPCWRW
jgi:hypothetical protein